MKRLAKIYKIEKDKFKKQRADDWVALMTPIIKAYATDIGSESANLAVQMYGGHGFIKDHGVEQFVRDARIAQLYEGTNGIQALDLVGRKLPMHNGRLLRSFFHEVKEYIEENAPKITSSEDLSSKIKNKEIKIGGLIRRAKDGKLYLVSPSKNGFKLKLYEGK
mgnify:CR=1 FL=1